MPALLTPAVSQSSLGSGGGAGGTPSDVEAVKADTVVFKKRYDDLTAEAQALRQKLAQLVERTNGFIPTSELEADKDDDAAEIAALEAEVTDLEGQTDVANHENMTYHLMIERIRSEAETYRRDLGEIDSTSSAKQSDAAQLQLMLKDATNVPQARPGCLHAASKVATNPIGFCPQQHQAAPRCALKDRIDGAERARLTKMNLCRHLINSQLPCCT